MEPAKENGTGKNDFSPAGKGRSKKVVIPILPALNNYPGSKMAIATKPRLDPLFYMSGKPAPVKLFIPVIKSKFGRI